MKTKLKKWQKMKLPKGWTQEQFLSEVETVVRLLAPDFKTYQDDIEDVKQDARMWAIEGVRRYDPSKGKLAGFLYTHIKNRLTNMRRKQYFCGECPCKLCRGGQPGGTKHEDRQFCQTYLDWINKNNSKQNVVVPTSLSNTDDDTEEALWLEYDFEGNLDISEALEKIDANLPFQLRGTYLQMREGVPGIPKSLREQVMSTIKKILANDE